MGKLWQIDGQSLNSPMFPPANVLRYTVCYKGGYLWVGLMSRGAYPLAYWPILGSLISEGVNTKYTLFSSCTRKY